MAHDLAFLFSLELGLGLGLTVSDGEGGDHDFCEFVVGEFEVWVADEVLALGAGGFVAGEELH